jgi:hypothetical protein|tara:strand:- start:243 stop:518 length:276 start_codon:yes stop_codon:yes gene_type:complete
LKNLFKRKPVQVPQSYRPVADSKEVIDLFGRMTLHQQAALLRLCSRNLMIDIDGDFHMGYDFDWNVSGAMIVATSEDLDLPIMLGEGSDPA